MVFSPLVYDSQKQLKLKVFSVISFSSAALNYWSVSNARLRFKHLENTIKQGQLAAFIFSAFPLKCPYIHYLMV